MESDLLRQIIPLAVLLFFSAFFSGTESAIFSLSRLEQVSLRSKSTSYQNRILKNILSSPDEILITILTGNMIVNVLASGLAEAIGDKIFLDESDLISILIMTVVLLLFGEMTPKNLAVRHAPAFVRSTALPLFYIHACFLPLRWVLAWVNRLVSTLFPHPAEAGAMERIVLSTVEIGFKEGILNRSEFELFESFLHFRTKNAGKIMIPRMQVEGFEITSRISSLLKTKKLGIGSILPVYQEDIDHIEGYLDIKKLLPFRYGLSYGEDLRQLMRPVLRVPVSKNCSDLLVEMKDTNTEMAVVIDEYGGTAGIITIDGLIIELFKFFYPDELHGVHRLEPGSYEVPGSLEIDQLASLIGLEIASASRTVAGLITESLENIPERGDRLVIEGVEYTVLEVDKNRVERVALKKLEKA